MARASTPTLLSLDRFAKILALSPVHFGGAVGNDVWLDNGACGDIWPQYAWQIDKEIVSREEVANAIASAERDIAQALGYWPAPVWTEDEFQAWPRYGAGTVTAEWGRMIAPGKRGVTAIELIAPVVYSDPDGDNFFELATIEVATTVTDRREVKLFFAGHDGDPEWEIRPLRDVVIEAGTATITLDSWLLIKPELWERYPSTNGFEAVDVTTTANYVTTVDVYRIFNDTSQAGSRFIYGPGGRDYRFWACSSCGGTGCGICQVTVKEGCFSVANNRLSTVRPFVATYEDDAWVSSPYVGFGYPGQVALNYYSGETDQRWRSGKSLDPLNDYFAEAITWLAVARLPKGVCGCGRVKTRVDELQRDASRFRDESNGAIYTRFEKMQIFNNPFGTRVGEVKAWERVSVIIQDQVWGAGVL